MSSRVWQQRVQDILDAIASIQRLTAEMTFTEFVDNEAITKAVLYNFIVIGEAAGNVPAYVQDQHPDIPWRLMNDMRNIMAHEYFQVNLRLTWGTIQRNLPMVVPQLQKLLELEQEL